MAMAAPSGLKVRGINDTMAVSSMRPANTKLMIDSWSMSEKHLSYGRWLNAPSKHMDDGGNRKHEKVRGIKERSLVHVGVCAFNSNPHVVFGSRLWLTILGRSPILRTRKAKEA